MVTATGSPKSSSCAARPRMLPVSPQVGPRCTRLPPSSLLSSSAQGVGEDDRVTPTDTQGRREPESGLEARSTRRAVGEPSHRVSPA